MALVTTTVTPSPRSFGFTGIGHEDPKDAIPRAELVYSFLDETIDSTGVADLMRLQVDIRLPQSYSYSLVDFALSIKGDQTDMTAKIPTGVTWQLFDAVTAAKQLALYSAEAPSIAGVLPVNANVGFDARIQYSVPHKPKMTWVLQPGEDGRCLINLTALDLNTAASEASGYFRFLQYDVDQAHHWAVNTPSLTR